MATFNLSKTCSQSSLWLSWNLSPKVDLHVTSDLFPKTCGKWTPCRLSEIIQILKVLKDGMVKLIRGLYSFPLTKNCQNEMGN